MAHWPQYANFNERRWGGGRAAYSVPCASIETATAWAYEWMQNHPSKKYVAISDRPRRDSTILRPYLRKPDGTIAGDVRWGLDLTGELKVPKNLAGSGNALDLGSILDRRLGGRSEPEPQSEPRPAPRGRSQRDSRAQAPDHDRRFTGTPTPRRRPTRASTMPDLISSGPRFRGGRNLDLGAALARVGIGEVQPSPSSSQQRRQEIRQAPAPRRSGGRPTPMRRRSSASTMPGLGFSGRRFGARNWRSPDHRDDDHYALWWGPADDPDEAEGFTEVDAYSAYGNQWTVNRYDFVGGYESFGDDQ